MGRTGAGDDGEAARGREEDGLAQAGLTGGEIEPADAAAGEERDGCAGAGGSSCGIDIGSSEDGEGTAAPGHAVERALGGVADVVEEEGSVVEGSEGEFWERLRRRAVTAGGFGVGGPDIEGGREIGVDHEEEHVFEDAIHGPEATFAGDVGDAGEPGSDVGIGLVVTGFGEECTGLGVVASRDAAEGEVGDIVGIVEELEGVVGGKGRIVAVEEGGIVLMESPRREGVGITQEEDGGTGEGCAGFGGVVEQGVAEASAEGGGFFGGWDFEGAGGPDIGAEGGEVGGGGGEGGGMNDEVEGRRRGEGGGEEEGEHGDGRAEGGRRRCGIVG